MHNSAFFLYRLLLKSCDIIILVINMSKKKKTVSYSSDSEEMIRMAKVLGLIVITFIAFYFVFAVLNGEITFGKKGKEEPVIQNVEIIAGETFNRPETTYYVMMYRFDSDESIKLSAFYDLYKATNGSNKIYVVDLAKKFSSNYITENQKEINIKNVDSLKVVESTPILIKVENGTGISYSLGLEQIEKTLFNK